MTALAIERLPNFAGSVPSRGTYPIAANVRIFKGALVCLNADGQAIPGNTIANGALVAVGKASATYDNRTGSALGGAAGAVEVEVEFGVFDFISGADTDALDAGDVGKVVFVLDDQTVTLTDNDGARCIAGVMTEFRGGKPFVFVGPHVGGALKFARDEAAAALLAALDADS